jgi:2-octaprenyl-6-methoxyphenol hydroxylase
VRQHFKMPVSRHDYGQSAIIATVKTAEDPAGRAFERFTDGGPLALLPMQDGLSSLCGAPRDEAQGLLALDDAAFLARLQQAFGWRLGRIERTGVRHLYPLVLTVADYPLASAPCWWATPPTCCTPSPVRVQPRHAGSGRADPDPGPCARGGRHRRL